MIIQWQNLNLRSAVRLQMYLFNNLLIAVLEKFEHNLKHYVDHVNQHSAQIKNETIQVAIFGCLQFFVFITLCFISIFLYSHMYHYTTFIRFFTSSSENVKDYNSSLLRNVYYFN